MKRLSFKQVSDYIISINRGHGTVSRLYTKGGNPVPKCYVLYSSEVPGGCKVYTTDPKNNKYEFLPIIYKYA